MDNNMKNQASPTKCKCGCKTIKKSFGYNVFCKFSGQKTVFWSDLGLEDVLKRVIENRPNGAFEVWNKPTEYYHYCSENYCHLGSHYIKEPMKITPIFINCESES